jgi:hypothetical protein
LAFAVSWVSGCYTVLQHPRVEEQEDDLETISAFAAVEDCRACHGAAWSPWSDPLPCPPPWYAWYREPWWKRTATTAAWRAEGSGLVNDRAPLPVPAFLPPPTATAPSPGTVVVPAVHTAAPNAPAARPSDPAATPHTQDPASRQSDPAATPHPPAAGSTVAAPADTTSDAAAPRAIGQGMSNTRRSPKP